MNIDKTFIEGSDAKTGIYSLSDGASHHIAHATDLSFCQKDALLGSGVICSPIGKGGMAAVYKIWNPKLEVFRAVKILLPLSQSDLYNRFETEAKITAKLRHPNIVEIYSIGEVHDLPYIEMEFVDGVSLDATILQNGRLPAQVCSAIAIFIARALTYAHSQECMLYGKTYHGVIHRDLKPANVMISKRGELRLMDFGIARPSETSLHTVSGNIVGTMQYLPPEQFDGVDVDNRADIYSFGTILYEMITGTKTFPQETVTTLMKHKITNEYRTFDDFGFQTPQSLVKIVRKCLKLDKRDRFATASELLADLEHAHKSFTKDSPEVVLKSYCDNPDNFKQTNTKQKKKFLNLKILIPVASLILVTAAILFVVMMHSYKSNQSTTIPTISEVPILSEPKPQPKDITTDKTIPVPISPIIDNRELNQPALKQSVSTKVNPPKLKSALPKQTLSPLDKLKLSYHSSNFFMIGQEAMEKHVYADAIIAFENMAADPKNADQAALMLTNAYLQTGRFTDAQTTIVSHKIDDAQYYLFSGEICRQTNKYKEALANFQTALTKPSKYMQNREVRSDALYFIALINSDIFAKDPTADNRGLMMQSWFVVKNMYAKDMGNTRYRKAVEALAGR